MKEIFENKKGQRTNEHEKRIRNITTKFPVCIQQRHQHHHHYHHYQQQFINSLMRVKMTPKRSFLRPLTIN